MALCGIQNYRKALTFSLHKWDIEKMSPKQSGKTLDDVIYYVQTSMYNDLVGPSNIDWILKTKIQQIAKNRLKIKIMWMMKIMNSPCQVNIYFLRFLLL